MSTTRFTFVSFLFAIFFTTAGAQPLVIDSTFNSTGYHMRPGIYARNILHLQDGSVIVTGAKAETLSLWKFLPSGALDVTFGHNGAGYMRMPSNFPTLILKDVQQQRDKKIIILADVENIDFVTTGNTDAAIMLVRFNSNGRIDSTFNGTGCLVSK